MGHFEKGRYIPDSEDYKIEIHNLMNTAGGIFGHNHKYSDEDIANKLLEVIKRVNKNTHRIDALEQMK